MNQRYAAIQLLRQHGIEDEDIYLVDLIPLIKMVWADQHAQPCELLVLEKFLIQHVHHINTVAGYPLMSYERAIAFVNRFLAENPTDELLSELTALVHPIRLSSSNDRLNQELRQTILYRCMDIASVCSAHRGCETQCALHGFFDHAEKKCFFEIMALLEEPIEG